MLRHLTADDIRFGRTGVGVAADSGYCLADGGGDVDGTAWVAEVFGQIGWRIISSGISIFDAHMLALMVLACMASAPLSVCMRYA